MTKERNDIRSVVRQSSPVDTTSPYDPAWLKGKTIIITGGSSGFGAGFARKWGQWANIIVADINDVIGKKLVEDLRASSGNPHHHYVPCNVTSWKSQVELFKTAARLSPHGGIDAVVANAGITDNGPPFDHPSGLDADEPPEPVWKCYEVNMKGVMYTTHLALFWLPKNPNSTKGAGVTPKPDIYTPDRHLLLIGSVASLAPIPGQIQYAIAKHGVLGLFRSLRSTAFMNGVRVNMLCPYFIDTPIIPAAGRAILAGAAMGKPEDVVDAGTRLMADNRIVGRALVIGPKVRINDETDDWELLPAESADGKVKAVWECYAEDFNEVDAFTARFVRMINQVEKARGWIGWAGDMVKAITYPVRTLIWGKTGV